MHALYTIHIAQKYPAEKESIGIHFLYVEARQHCQSYITLSNIP